MKTLRFVLALVFAFFAFFAFGQSAAPGSIVWQRVAGTPIVYKPDGTTLNISTSVTFGLQEALNYWGSVNSPLRIFCGGQADPFVFPNDTTLTVPPSYSLFEARGCWFFLTNPNGGHGFIYDTQQANLIDLSGTHTYCTGCQTIVLLQPKFALRGVPWSNNSDYLLGYIASLGTSTPLALDITQVAGVDQQTSSAFITNRVTAILEGNGVAPFGFRYVSPVSPHQAGGENTFTFPHISGALYAEMYLGTLGGSIMDQQLGTNKYIGNLARTVAGGYNILTNVPWDWYDLRSMNVYVPGATYNVVWGTHACLNVIRTTQVIPGSLGMADNYCPANNNIIATP